MANETRLDPMDERILAILQEDGRRTYAEIASLVGLTAPSAHERVKKLEARGTILGYAASVDAHQAGFGVLAFVLVAQEVYSDWASVTSRFRTMPEVVECHHVAGDEDFVLKVRARDTGHLERILREIQLSGHVRSLRTIVVLSSPLEGRGLPIGLDTPLPNVRAANHRARLGVAPEIPLAEPDAVVQPDAAVPPADAFGAHLAPAPASPPPPAAAQTGETASA
jgi:Lrp/AsnC family leucine-responsive transcriptional regulator